MIDWRYCPDVDRTPGIVSGQWKVVGTRILAECVTDNADDSSPEEIAAMFPCLGVDRARRIIEYVNQHADASAAAR